MTYNVYLYVKEYFGMAGEREIWLAYSEDENRGFPEDTRGVVVGGMFRPLSELVGEEALKAGGLDMPIVTAGDVSNQESWKALCREVEYRATLDLGDY